LLTANAYPQSTAKDIDAFVQVKTGDHTSKSKIIYNTPAPVWDFRAEWDVIDVLSAPVCYRSALFVHLKSISHLFVVLYFLLRTAADHHLI
jgi:hypothetical protein